MPNKNDVICITIVQRDGQWFPRIETKDNSVSPGGYPCESLRDALRWIDVGCCDDDCCGPHEEECTPELLAKWGKPG